MNETVINFTLSAPAVRLLAELTEKAVASGRDAAALAELYGVAQRAKAEAETPKG